MSEPKWEVCGELESEIVISAGLEGFYWGTEDRVEVLNGPYPTREAAMKAAKEAMGGDDE